MFVAFPSIVALAIVLSIWSWYAVSCWGRRIATSLSSVLGILGVGWLYWFSIPVVIASIFLIFCFFGLFLSSETVGVIGFG